MMMWKSTCNQNICLLQNQAFVISLQELQALSQEQLWPVLSTCLYIFPKIQGSCIYYPNFYLRQLVPIHSRIIESFSWKTPIRSSPITDCFNTYTVNTFNTCVFVNQLLFSSAFKEGKGVLVTGHLDWWFSTVSLQGTRQHPHVYLCLTDVGFCCNLSFSWMYKV